MDNHASEINRKAEELSNDPRMKRIISKLQKLPFWFMGGAVLLPLATYKYLPINRVTGGRKRIHLFAMGLFGGMVGLQAGVWRVKRFYTSVDPDGTLWRQAEELVKEAQNAPPPKVIPINEKHDSSEKHDIRDGVFVDGLFSGEDDKK
jgi:hypothetical protein